MGTSCDALNQTSRGHKLHDEIENSKAADSIPLDLKDSEMMSWLEKTIQKYENWKGRVFKEKDVKAAIKKRYGSKALREQWVAKLNLILDANEGIRDIIWDTALMEMIKVKDKSVFTESYKERLQQLADDAKLKKFPTLSSSWGDLRKVGAVVGVEYDDSIHTTKEKFLFDIMNKQRGFTYSDLPVATLKLLYNMSWDIVKNGYGSHIGKGVWGTLLVELSTPLKLSLHDATGAIYIVAKSVTSYTVAITQHVNRFLKGNVFKKSGKRHKRGMDHVFKDIVDGIKLPQEINEKLKMPEAFKTDFFTRLMLGWVIWDDATGQYLINSEYEPDTDADGNVKTYPETGDIMYKFQNPITFEEYLKNKAKYQEQIKNLKKGQRLPKQHYSSFQISSEYIDMINYLAEYKHDTIAKLQEEGYAISKEAYDYAAKEMEETHIKLVAELQNYFPDLEKDDIAELLKSEDITQEFEFEMLTKKQQKDLLFIMDAFSGYSLFEPLFLGMQDFGEKESGHYPIIYNQQYFHNVMWEEALSEALDALQSRKSDLSRLRNLYKASPDDADIKNALNETLKEFNKQKKLVHRMTFLRDRFDEYPMDVETGVPMPLARDVGHLKTITNAFDVRNARRDSGVYADYLRNIFGGIERNKLSVNLLIAIRKAESDSVREELVSLYKGIQNDPSAKSSLMGIPIDLETVTRKLNNIGIDINPQTASRKLRIFNSWITGMGLRQFSTAAVNATAIQESLYHVGLKGISEALSEIRTYKDGIERIVGMSGITDFNEFISQGMINKAVDLDFTHDAAKDVVKAMFLYWKRISNGVDRDVALTELNKKVRISAETIPDVDRLNKRKVKMRDEKIQRMVNTFANFAINKEYEAKPNVKNIPYKLIFGGFGFYSKILTGSPVKSFTMGSTESWLRQLQFVVGIVSARRSGILPDIPISEYEGDVLGQAIELGRQYVQLSAFSIGRENLGRAVRGEVGATATKFKYYSLQKFGADVNRFKNTYYEIMETSKDGEPGSFLATTAKMFERVLRFRKYPQDVLRTTDPNVAQLRSFLMVQGLLTVMVDTFLFGPFAAAKLIPGVRGALYSLPGVSYVGGATSDVISLMWALPNLMLALSMGEGPDDDDWEDVFTYYMRRSFLGWGVTYTWDNILTLASMLTKSDEEERAQRVMRTLSPVVPKEINYLTNHALQSYLEDNLDW